MVTPPPSGSPGTRRTRSARSSSTSPPTSANEPYAEVESVKAVSDVVAPLSGEVIEVNETLADAPEKVNEDPYGEGWLVKVRLSDPAEADELMDRETYEGSLT